jgi:hypothetical protein
MTGASVGQAYVQIIPSAKGISSSISREINGGAAPAGAGYGSKFASVLKKVFAAAAVGKALTATIMEGAKLEQSLGGIETLYKGSSDKMVAYANQEYKTAGMSANQYMENVTSFSASLIKSVGGDTEKAADIANQSMIDMSDNANKMGTDMMSIQDAYQGFAKQNYTMLDNLKLGYGGTKTEMERLLADATKLTGVKYDINNLADVYEAIHVIQEDLGITGTTAKEAAETLSGSFNAMKGSFKDFLGNLALGKDITPSLKNLVESASIFLFNNLLPAIGNIVKALPSVIGTFITVGMPALINGLIQMGKEIIASLSKGISDAPAVFDSIKKMLDQAITWIKTKLPIFLESGGQFILKMAQGLINNLPTLYQKFGEIFPKIVNAIGTALPIILEKAGKLFGQLAVAVVKALPSILVAVGGMLLKIVGAIIAYIPKVIGAAFRFIGGFISGITSKAGAVLSAVKRAILAPFEWVRDKIKGIIDRIKGFFSFKFKIPKIPLPHITVSPSGWKLHHVLTKGTIPKLGIKWYEKGGIADKPVLFGGMGEAGPEGIVPLTPFWKKLDRMYESLSQSVEKQIASIKSIEAGQQVNNYNQIVNQTIEINSPVKSPAETARAIREEAVRLGLAGVI